MSFDYLQTQVVVVGAGSAGISAAIAAARSGVKTILIEKDSELGGTSVKSWVSPFMSFHDSNSNPVNGGFLDEIIMELKKIGGTTGSLECKGKPPWGKNSTITPFDPYLLSYTYIRLLEDAGVNIMLHSFVSDVIMEKNNIVGVIVEGKGGRKIISSQVVIDASGDADVAYLSGVSYNKGRQKDGLMQPATLYFRLGDVQFDKIKNYLENNLDDFRWYAFPVVKEPIIEKYDPEAFAFSGFIKAIEDSCQNGELHLGRETLNAFPGLRKGELIANATRVNNIDSTNSLDLTKAELDCRKQVVSFVNFAKKSLPGFANCYLINWASQVGIRESRRIVGDYILNEKDIIDGRHFEDVIVRSTYPIDIHNPDNKQSTWKSLSALYYEIPYRSLVPKNIEKLLVAGRCISTTEEAHASTRVIPNCISMGQAAGMAAAISIDEKTEVRKINISKLQQRLIKTGQLVDVN